MQDVFENIIKKLESLENVFIKGNSHNVAAGISRAIEIVKEETEYEECYKDCEECEAYYKEKHHCTKFCKVITEAVKEIEENHNGWILCSERLPEEREAVLLNDFDGFYELGICIVKCGIKGFQAGDWWSSANNYIAWQPLPQPYQPKGE